MPAKSIRRTERKPEELPGRRNVLSLGLVSMFNDVASEMVYPLIPVFLTTVLRAPVAVVGIIEGVAEATASILKVFSGWLSDRVGNRKRFVASGYLFSALAKILLAAAGAWFTVLGARFIDRLGKGVRTSARDALIADSVSENRRGASFGLHRALDSAGAVLGPLLALLLLHLYSENYRLIFWFAALPAFIGVGILLLLVREPRRQSVAREPIRLSFRQLNPRFKHFLLVSSIFALGNSSDAFLILRAQSFGYTAAQAVFLYVAFNFTYSIFSYPFGKLADRFGAKPILIAAFIIFGMIYSGFAFAPAAVYLWILFPLYGVYMAMSDGVSKAYIVENTPANLRGSLLGLFHTVTGIIAFLASFIAGLLWSYLGIPAPFYFGAALAWLAALLFILFTPASPQSHLSQPA